MKSNKVFLGLFAGVLALIGSSAGAQNDTNFYEIGPSNIGGQISSLVLDQHDTSHTTIYAGAASGGLYVRSDNEQTLEKLYTSRDMDLRLAKKHEIWHYVPCVTGSPNEVIPVSAMVMGPDNTLFIGTGDDYFYRGILYGRMSSYGKGIFRLNTNTFQSTVIPNTKPNPQNNKFAAVRAIDYVMRNGVLYMYAATSTGIYRWVVDDESDWNNAPQTVFVGNVESFEMVRSLKMAYFSVGGHLYKIGDVTSESLSGIYEDISASNSGFGIDGTHLKITVAPSDPSFIYVMVIGANGSMSNIFLTNDLQTWNNLATQTVTPFATNNGASCGAMAVDPGNPRHIYLAGSTIWSGTGFPGAGYYQWMKSSNSEYELNSGDYMSTVYNYAGFVHSGIHQIIPVYRPDRTLGYSTLSYYIATDGGVFSTSSFNSYSNLNQGLNTLQVNSIAVSPDGSIISGANTNACPFIEARMAHDGGNADTTWFYNGNLGNINHNANILWKGSGGKVAASMFQQLAPRERRNIYVSSEGGRYGRAYGDYLDFTNSQTWTIGSSFMSQNLLGPGPAIGEISLWETNNNQIFQDSLRIVPNTLAYVLRINSQNGYDTVRVTGEDFQIRKYDKAVFLSRPNSEYPFEYIFLKNQTLNDTIIVKAQSLSRMLAIATDSAKTSKHSVYISWRAGDFTKVWAAGALTESQNLWAPIYSITSDTTMPRTMTMSEDGTQAYIAVQNNILRQSFIVRVRGFETINYFADANEVRNNLSYPKYLYPSSKILVDTLYQGDGKMWFERTISSLTSKGNDLIVTFDGMSANYANVAIVKNVNQLTGYTFNQKTITTVGAEVPAYCAMVEDSTGNIYVGTAEGVSVLSGNTWSDYPNIKGVAVTSIVQQKGKLPVRRHMSVSGIDTVKYVFAKTKWPGAIYFGTYGRGIFMDMKYVSDRTNEVSDPEDYNPVGIPTVHSTAVNNITIYPNPVMGDAHLDITANEAGNARIMIYDLNGHCVSDRSLGYINEGKQTYTISTESMAKGMYLINVIISGHTTAAKMMVR